MSKPEDVPQDVWDHADVLAKEATRDAMRDPLMPYFITVRPYFARAIMAAKAEERAACMADLLLMVHRHGEPGAMAENPYVDLNKAVTAIRKRGEG